MRQKKELPILPGATIGILGSGQLGRMLAIAASRLGYYVNVYSPEINSPAGQVAQTETIGNYNDISNIVAFADSVDVTAESIPPETPTTSVSKLFLWA